MSKYNGALEGAVNNLVGTKSQISHNKVKKSSQKRYEIVHEIVYGGHFRILLKVHLKVQKSSKSGPLKREVKGAIYNAPGVAKESGNGTTINMFKAAFDGTVESAPENTSGNAL